MYRSMHIAMHFCEQIESIKSRNVLDKDYNNKINYKE